MGTMDEYELMDKMEELDKLKKQQEEIKLENTLLSEHLSRVVARKGSMLIHLDNVEAEEIERQEAGQEEREAAEAAIAALTAVTPTDAAMRRSTIRTFSVFRSRSITPPGAKASRASVRFSVSPPPRPRRVIPPRAPMSLEEKLDVVDEEIACHDEEMNRLRTENERTLDDLRAVLKETEFTIREIANDRNSFQRDLLILAEVHPKKKLFSEDFLRFQRWRMKKKQNVRAILEERLDIFHQEIMEAEHQFAGKKDLKDILQAVDFEQLRVQRLKLNARIRERTSTVWRYKGSIKLISGLLEKARRELEGRVAESKRLRQSIADRTPQIASSVDLINVEKKQLKKLNDELIRMIQDRDGPPQPRVFEYMQYRIRSASLSKELKAWLTKVEIIEQGHHQLKRKVREVQKKRDAILESMPDPLRGIPSVTPVSVVSVGA